jgi:hypothetical protein
MKRRQKKNGRGLIELEVLKRQEVEGRGADQKNTSKKLVHQLARRQSPSHLFRAEHYDDQQGVDHEANPDNLQYWQMRNRRQILCARVKRKDRKPRR